jgi:DNA-binding CsgD family transcriptional regulator
MTNSSVPKGRILVVDDDADFLEMTESFLEENYEVSLAPSVPYPRERKIALLAQKHLASAEIAEAMGTTDRTIRTALSSIYMKFNIHSKWELANFDLESEG